MFAVWFAMLTARLFGLFDYVVLVWYLLFELFCLGIVVFWLMGGAGTTVVWNYCCRLSLCGWLL